MQDEKWYDFLHHPSPKWGERRCHLCVMTFTIVLVFFSDDSVCSPLPLNFWMLGQFTLFMFDYLTQEFKDRVWENQYWQARRTLRKRLLIAFIVFKEICDTIWIIYGIKSFWGKDFKALRKGKC
jgi:hypothetical protein